jgi:hypothetical protein
MISDSKRIRSKGTGIDDYSVGPVSGRVDYVDDLAFDVRFGMLAGRLGSRALEQPAVH